jgi:hypothetical protein
MLLLYNLKYYPSIRLEGLRKTVKERSQNSGSPDWELYPRPPNMKQLSMGCSVRFFWWQQWALEYHKMQGIFFDQLIQYRCLTL